MATHRAKSGYIDILNTILKSEIFCFVRIDKVSNLVRY